jgi:hypothetical protein
MLMFSEETIASIVFSQEAQSGTVSAFVFAQPITASISVLKQDIQDRTIFVLLAIKLSTIPLLIFKQERLIKDITISL